MYADVVLTTGNRPTLPQCGKEGVVLNGLRSLDFKRLMMMDELVMVGIFILYSLLVTSEEVKFLFTESFIYVCFIILILYSEVMFFRYGVSLEVTTGIGVPLIPAETKDVFRRRLNSYNTWALTGL